MQSIHIFSRFVNTFMWEYCIIMRKKPSISSIARQVGVSYATVSRALNFPEKVKPETLRKIRKVFAELNFKPRVVPNRLNTLCLLVTDSTKMADILPRAGDLLIVEHILEMLHEQDIQVVVIPYSKVESLPEIFRGRFIGFLHGEGNQANVDIINKLSRSAVVTIINDTSDILDDNVHTICSDHRQGMILAMDHFSSRGHKKIGFISRPIRTRGEKERFDAYREWMEKAGSFNPALVYMNSPELLPEGLRRICREGVTALLSPYQELTPRVLYGLSLLEKSVPDDISLISVAHGHGEGFKFPQLTELIQQLDILAKKAVNICLNNPRIQKFDKVPYELRDRESVKFI